MSIIASASENLKFHQWPEGALKHVYIPGKKEEGSFVQTISWSKDGKWLALVPKSGPVEMVTVRDHIKLLQTVQEIAYPTCSVFQNTTKRNIAVGTLSGQIMIYDIKSKKVQNRFPRVSSKINTLHFNSKDTHVAAGFANGQVVLFNNHSTIMSSTYKISNSSSNNVTGIDFHRTKRNIFSACSEDGLVAVWDMNDKKFCCNFTAHYAPVTDIKFSPIRSDLLVSSGLDRRVQFYDLVSKKSILEVEVSSSITSLDFSSCGMYLGLGSQSGSIALYDTRHLDKPISTFEAHQTKIRRLLFQKVLNGQEKERNSIYEVPIEESVTPNDESQNKNRVSESVDSPMGLSLMRNSETPENVSTVKTDASSRQFSEEFDDSFLAALGLESSCVFDAPLKRKSNAGSVGGEASKRVSFCQNTSQKSTHLPTPPTLRQILSTPKLHVPEEQLCEFVSPIISGNQTIPTTSQCATTTAKIQAAVSRDELKAVVREVFQQEIKTHMEEFQKELREEYTHGVYQIGKNFLNLQMTMVKEFLKIESMFANLQANTKSCDCNRLDSGQ